MHPLPPLPETCPGASWPLEVSGTDEHVHKTRGCLLRAAARSRFKKLNGGIE
jgi:hypothetical protein